MALTQNERNKKWEEKNKEYSNYLKSRSTAKSFILKKSTLEDLKDFEEYIKERRKQLEEV